MRYKSRKTERKEEKRNEKLTHIQSVSTRLRSNTSANSCSLLIPTFQRKTQLFSGATDPLPLLVARMRPICLQSTLSSISYFHYSHSKNPCFIQLFLTTSTSRCTVRNRRNSVIKDVLRDGYSDDVTMALKYSTKGVVDPIYIVHDVEHDPGRKEYGNHYQWQGVVQLPGLRLFGREEGGSGELGTDDSGGGSAKVAEVHDPSDQVSLE